jgi:hypothetical protein
VERLLYSSRNASLPFGVALSEPIVELGIDDEPRREFLLPQEHSWPPIKRYLRLSAISLRAWKRKIWLVVTV